LAAAFGQRLPINIFFRSLAQHQQQWVIRIVLAGKVCVIATPERLR